MDYRKNRTKILPVKVSDVFHSNLKYVAENEGVSVSTFVRTNLDLIIKKKMHVLQKKRPKKKMTLLELAETYAWRGKTYYEDKTDDELLYGGKLGEY